MKRLTVGSITTALLGLVLWACAIRSGFTGDRSGAIAWAIASATAFVGARALLSDGSRQKEEVSEVEKNLAIIRFAWKRGETKLFAAIMAAAIIFRILTW